MVLVMVGFNLCESSGDSELSSAGANGKQEGVIIAQCAIHSARIFEDAPTQRCAFISHIISHNMCILTFGLTLKVKFSTENPFNGPVPQSVALPRTPLTAVLAQVRFPEILSVASAEFVSGFQEMIREDYPHCEQSTEHLLELRPPGVNQSMSKNWRFKDSTGNWRATLGSGFFALETRSYSSREDFTTRIALLASALSETIKPSSMSRIGIRYVDRICGDAFHRLERFVRPEVLGAFNESSCENIEQTWTQMTATASPGRLSARWGCMPRGLTHEPDLMPAIDESCWFLDTDAYMEFKELEKFDSAKIQKYLASLATRSYGLFRWAVSEDFIRQCGGEV